MLKDGENLRYPVLLPRRHTGLVRTIINRVSCAIIPIPFELTSSFYMGHITSLGLFKSFYPLKKKKKKDGRAEKTKMILMFYQKKNEMIM